MHKLWDAKRDGDIARTPEDRVAIHKVVHHTLDYCRAVQKFGRGFYEKKPRLTERNRYCYENGCLAYRFFFDGDSEDSLGFEMLAENFGWNANAMRRRLLELTPKDIKPFGRFYTHLLGGPRGRGKSINIKGSEANENTCTTSI